MEANSKTSVLVSDQLPKFVRDDHPKFVQFLEKYYEFLEQEDGLLDRSKNLNVYQNVDLADDLFRQKIYDSFISLLDKNIVADKNLIVKYAKDFYRAKGTENSIRFLARILFDKEIEFYYPKLDILKASDGKWFIDKSISVRDVAVDNTSNSYAVSVFPSKYIVGESSNASAIVESVSKYLQKGELVTELKLSGTRKNFIDGEKIISYFDDQGVTKQLSAIVSSGFIARTTIIDGGAGYIVGSVVPLENETGSNAVVKIGSVTTGSLAGIGVINGGAGFRVNDSIAVVTAPGKTGSGGSGAVYLVDTSEKYHPNSYTIYSSTIASEANTPLSNAYQNLVSVYTNTSNLLISTGSGASVSYINLDKNSAYSNVYFETFDQLNVNNTIVTITYSSPSSNLLIVTPGLPGSLSNKWFSIIKKANANTAIANSLYSWLYSNCGPIQSCSTVNGGSNYNAVPSLDVVSNTAIRSLGILGKMEIINGGLGYEVNDPISFQNVIGGRGDGATAYVSQVAANGMIKEVKFGSVPGHHIGGSGYDMNFLPNVIVTSANTQAYGANVVIATLIGDGESLFTVNTTIGTITSLKIEFGGSGYTSNPTLNLTSLGDGTAIAYANISTLVGNYSFQGRYINDDGHISSYNFLQDRDYYQNFSYVIRISESISKYRDRISKLAHPLGMKLFGQYTFLDDNDISVRTSSEDSLLSVLTDSTYTVPYRSSTFNVAMNKAAYTEISSNGSFSTSGNTAIEGTYSANGTIVSIRAPNHTFVANDYTYLSFTSNVNANIVNGIYSITGSGNGAFLITFANSISNTGNVTIYNPKVTYAVSNNTINANDVIHIQHSIGLENTIFTVSTANSSQFTVINPNTRLITNESEKTGTFNTYAQIMTITSTNHGFTANDVTYIRFDTGDLANTSNGLYAVQSVINGNSFIISTNDAVMFGGNCYIHLNSVTMNCANHQLSNGDYVQIWFTPGTANISNGIYSANVINSNTYTIVTQYPAASNGFANVYSNKTVINITKTNHGFSANDLIRLEFRSGDLASLANDVFKVISVANANSYSIYHDSMIFLANSNVAFTESNNYGIATIGIYN